MTRFRSPDCSANYVRELREHIILSFSMRAEMSFTRIQEAMREASRASHKPADCLSLTPQAQTLLHRMSAKPQVRTRGCFLPNLKSPALITWHYFRTSKSALPL